MKNLARLFILISLLLVPMLAEAQVTQVVLGVGRIGFDVGSAAVPMTQAAAQAQKYRLYTPSTALNGATVLVTCGAAVNGVVPCTFPISVFTLPSAPNTLSFAVSAAVTAVDGEQESAKATAPFVLQKAGQAVAPQAAMSVLPAP